MARSAPGRQRRGWWLSTRPTPTSSGKVIERGINSNSGKQRAVTGEQPAEGGDGGAEGANEGTNANPGPGVEGPRSS